MHPFVSFQGLTSMVHGQVHDDFIRQRFGFLFPSEEKDGSMKGNAVKTCTDQQHLHDGFLWRRV